MRVDKPPPNWQKGNDVKSVERAKMTKHCNDCKHVITDKLGIRRCKLDPIPPENNPALVDWLVNGEGDRPGADTEFFLAKTARAVHGDCGFDAKLFEAKEPAQ